MNVFYNIFTNSLNLGLIYAVLGIGVYLAYRVLDIADLGAEGVFPLGGAVTILMIALGVPPLVAVIISFVAGGIMGLLTGVLHTKLRIPSLLAGIITMVICVPFSQLLNGITNSLNGYSHIGDFVGSLTITGIPTIFTFFRSLLGEWGYIVSSLLTIGVIIAVLYWFFGTELGITIRATGKNKIMSRAQGINTDSRVILGLVLSNAIVAMSGSLFSQMMLTSNSTFGQGSIVIALASILLGEAIMLYGKPNFAVSLISVLVGSFVYQLVINLAMRLLDDNGYLKLVQAVLFVIILCIPLLKKHITALKKKAMARRNAHA
ncbi:MAG: ABC transporter permease [Bacteroidia bacterium]|nr:ABC transporter permease [Bacteroidia bacterium]